MFQLTTIETDIKPHKNTQQKQNIIILAGQKKKAFRSGRRRTQAEICSQRLFVQSISLSQQIYLQCSYKFSDVWRELTVMAEFRFRLELTATYGASCYSTSSDHPTCCSL